MNYENLAMELTKLWAQYNEYPPKKEDIVNVFFYYLNEIKNQFSKNTIPSITDLSEPIPPYGTKIYC